MELYSLAGGLAVGLGYFVALLVFVNFSQCGNQVTWTSQGRVIVLGGVAGLVGSVVDSLLGATVQYSGYSTKLDKVVNSPSHHAEAGRIEHVSGMDILDNHAVNFVSSLITAIAVPFTYLYLCS